jgi:CheY-like chemotaxis protein
LVVLRADSKLGFPSDVIDDFDRLVAAWAAGLSENRPFTWEGALPLDKIRRLAAHWADVATLARDASTSLRMPPPEAAAFYEAVVSAVVNATELSGPRDRFADVFAEVVPPFIPEPEPERPATVSTKVLIVDDTDDMRLLLRIGLSRSGSIVVCGEAENGRVALEKCADLQPDAVLLDVAMPEMDGLAALQELKATWPDLHVVMFSADDRPEVRQTALARGAAAFLTKSTPLDAVALALLRQDL